MTVKNIGCLRQKMAIPLGTEENLRGERGQQEEKILRLADVFTLLIGFFVGLIVEVIGTVLRGISHLRIQMYLVFLSEPHLYGSIGI